MPPIPPPPEAYLRGEAAAPASFPGFRDPALERAAGKLGRGERLGFEDGVALFRSQDLTGIGVLADWAKTRLWGDQVFFVYNRQINPTNACVLDCRFCDYALRPSDPQAVELTIEQILSKIRPEMREVHITGSLHPQRRFEDYVEIVRRIRQAFPAIQIKAYTAVEIDFFSKIARLSVEEVLETLSAAGLDALPGGGAEVFSERVRRELFPKKIGHEAWLSIHRTAHRLGIPSNCTLLYGHIETHEERVDHLLKLRGLEDEAPGFLAFIALAFQVGTSGIVERPASGCEDLKTVAVSRLLLDNIPHIKAYWVMLGEETASVALNFGADDMDGTILEERIAHAALAESPAGLTRDRLLGLIREAGKLPVERDALYKILRRYPDDAGR
jgi:aminodeoxyfutalosine synthase